MTVIIDIPEDVYTRLFDNGIQDNEIATDDICEMARALRLGKPLPKGHGAIVDLKKVIRVEIEEFHTCKKMVWNNNPKINNTMLYVVAPTIIEADKGE